MKTILTTILGLTLISFSACNKTEVENIEPNQLQGAKQYKSTTIQPSDFTNNKVIDARKLQLYQAYFEGSIYNLELKKSIDEPGNSLPPLKREPMELYVYNGNQAERSNKTLLPIAGSVDNAGVTMLLREIKIRFNAGFEPHQFYSRDEVLRATIGIRPEINLEITGVAYEARVVGNAIHSSPLANTLTVR
ncbi:MAG: hypothetical protein KA149_03700 [Chitinophagales bacterium]|nr:hypothetical protein [Chitinophagales bacterium]